MKGRPQRVLVTGGSSGIGRALVLRLAQEGVAAIDVSNVPGELAELEGRLPGGGVLECDLTVDEQVGDLFGRAEAHFGPIDVLVNNAGIGYHAGLTEIDLGQLRRLFEVNFFAMVSLSQQALRVMGERGGGQIVNVTSASARRGLARMCAYAASKGAAHTFTQSLRLEAASHGVRVTEILPISVATPFFAQARNESKREYRPRGMVQTSEQVAGIIWRNLLHPGREVCTSGATGWALGLDALFPNLINRLLAWQERLQNK